MGSRASRFDVIGTARHQLRAELRMTFFHPIMIGGATTSTIIAFVSLRVSAPVWPDASVRLGTALLPLTACSFLLGSWQASRAVRQGTREWLDSLPHDVRSEVAAHVLLGVVPVSWALLISTAAVGFVLLGAAAGSVAAAEIMGGVAMVAAAWALGVLCGTKTAAGVIPVLVLISAAFVQLVASPDVSLGAAVERGPDLGRLAIWMPASAFDTPIDLMTRPSAEHLVYVVAAAMAAAVASLASVAPASFPLRVSALGTFGVVVLTAVPLVRAPSPRVDWSTLIADQQCTTLVGVEYCAFDLFEGWIPEWAETIADVSRVIDVRATRVVQRPSSISVGDDPARGHHDTVFVSTEWDRRGANRPTRRFRLATEATYPTLGLPTSNLPCSGVGQARAAVALWAAAASFNTGRDVLESSLEESGDTLTVGGEPTIGPVVFGTPAARLAELMSGMDTEEVAQVVLARLPALNDAATTLQALAGWLGISWEATEVEVAAPPCP